MLLWKWSEIYGLLFLLITRVGVLKHLIVTVESVYFCTSISFCSVYSETLLLGMEILTELALCSPKNHFMTF